MKNISATCWLLFVATLLCSAAIAAGDSNSPFWMPVHAVPSELISSGIPSSASNRLSNPLSPASAFDRRNLNFVQFLIDAPNLPTRPQRRPIPPLLDVVPFTTIPLMPTATPIAGPPPPSSSLARAPITLTTPVLITTAETVTTLPISSTVRAVSQQIDAIKDATLKDAAESNLVVEKTGNRTRSTDLSFPEPLPIMQKASAAEVVVLQKVVNCLESSVRIAITFKEPFRGIIHSGGLHPRCIFAKGSEAPQTLVEFSIPERGCEDAVSLVSKLGSSRNDLPVVSYMIAIQPTQNVSQKISDASFSFVCNRTKSEDLNLFTKLPNRLSTLVLRNSDFVGDISRTPTEHPPLPVFRYVDAKTSPFNRRLEQETAQSSSSSKSRQTFWSSKLVKEGDFEGPVINQSVDLGERLTFAVFCRQAKQRESGGNEPFCNVGPCWAHNSNGSRLVQLSDEIGCSLYPEFWSDFKYRPSSHGGRPYTILHSSVSAWCFPSDNRVVIRCDIDFCGRPQTDGIVVSSNISSSRIFSNDNSCDKSLYAAEQDSSTVQAIRRSEQCSTVRRQDSPAAFITPAATSKPGRLGIVDKTATSEVLSANLEISTVPAAAAQKVFKDQPEQQEPEQNARSSHTLSDIADHRRQPDADPVTALKHYRTMNSYQVAFANGIKAHDDLANLRNSDATMFPSTSAASPDFPLLSNHNEPDESPVQASALNDARLSQTFLIIISLLTVAFVCSCVMIAVLFRSLRKTNKRLQTLNRLRDAASNYATPTKMTNSMNNLAPNVNAALTAVKKLPRYKLETNTARR